VEEPLGRKIIWRRFGFLFSAFLGGVVSSIDSWVIAKRASVRLKFLLGDGFKGLGAVFGTGIFKTAGHVVGMLLTHKLSNLTRIFRLGAYEGPNITTMLFKNK
jgi:hypothetical protein